MPDGVVLHEIWIDAQARDLSSELVALAHVYRIDLRTFRALGKTLVLRRLKPIDDATSRPIFEVDVPVTDSSLRLIYRQAAYGLEEFVWVSFIGWSHDETTLRRLGTVLLGSYLRLCPIRSGDLLIDPELGLAEFPPDKHDFVVKRRLAFALGEVPGLPTGLKFEGNVGRARFGDVMRYDRDFTLAVQVSN